MRVTNAPASRKRRRRWLKSAKGFWLRRSKLYRYAKDALDHGRQYAYRDRRNKKRTFRGLWNVRINAACKAADISYSRFIEGLKAAKVEINRKILADIAAQDEAAFLEIINLAKTALAEKGGQPAPAKPAPKTKSKPEPVAEEKPAAEEESAAEEEPATEEEAKDGE